MLKTAAALRSSPASRSKFMTLILSWLGKRSLKMRTSQELNRLSDTHLKDIGVERREIGEVIERELERLRRSDLAWHK